MRPLHQLDEVNSSHLRFDHLDLVTDFLSESASRHESDRVVSSEFIAKPDDPN
jgi:hypothetical protein